MEAAAAPITNSLLENNVNVAAAQSVSLPANNTTPNTLQAPHSSIQGQEKSSNKTRTNPTQQRSTRIDSKENSSVIGSMTTWVPPTANLTTNRSQLDISTSPPQSIAIVAGRKYIMVPKTNLMSVSPSGEVKIGDNNGIPLPYVDDAAAAPQQTM